jgi:GNAT superfamily N-acetyltransferase
MTHFQLRPATESDIPTIFSFIMQLADYERLKHEVVATEARLRETLFGETRYAEVIFAVVEDQPVGFALYFHNYSTFLAKPGLYLEDLFVVPSHRGKGLGKALLAALAQIAVERDCGRLDWNVLDWNQPAIDFYTAIGAVAVSEWNTFRMTGDALETLASSSGVVGTPQ